MPPAKGRRSMLAAIALAAITIAPLALAQTATTPKKKKATKTAASASASASASAAPAANASASAAPASDSTTSDDTDTTTTTKPTPAPEATEGTDVPPVTPPLTEDPNKAYYFIGARYRGTVVPSFLEHLFVNDGGTIYTNTIGVEAERRKDGQSMIGWIAFTEYGFGNTLFFQKNEPDLPQNYSIVNSGLKGLYVGLDESWSVPIRNDLQFEYGFGIGLGVIFGSLENDWVTPAQGNVAQPGAVQGSNGTYYVPCQAQSDGPSCTTGDHQNASTAKVAGYVEKTWLNGGAVPVVFPHIAIPQLGLRYKPIPELEARLSLGFSITGFWFGLSADYGLEQRPHTEKAAPAPSASPSGPAHAHPHEHQDSGDDTL
jgi:hypothetical protein